MSVAADPAELFEKLSEQVVKPGNCTQCGTCAGLNPTLIHFKETSRGPVPTLSRTPEASDERALRLAWAACPGRGAPYPELWKSVGATGFAPLLGPYSDLYTGYAGDPAIRRAGASGGVITAMLTHLVSSGQAKVALLLKQGVGSPEGAGPTLCRTPQEILACAQSIYRVTPLLTGLALLDAVEGPVAMAGLPDQIAAVRMLQAAGDARALKIKWIFGLYTGTNLLPGAVRAFLRNRRISDRLAIKKLAWRYGEWPGKLRVEMVDGTVVEEKKFYYNYLIPFFIAPSSLRTQDFSGELSDVSVGDAWSPKFESQGGGHSVVVARSATGRALLKEMSAAGALKLEPATLDFAQSMHGHMMDFKKRGTAIRLGWLARKGPVPDFGYSPANIPASRRAVEWVLWLIFTLAGTSVARKIAERVPPSVLGFVFDELRKAWKNFSKPFKRAGLREIKLTIRDNSARMRELRELAQ